MKCVGCVLLTGVFAFVAATSLLGQSQKVQGSEVPVFVKSVHFKSGGDSVVANHELRRIANWVEKKGVGKYRFKILGMFCDSDEKLTEAKDKAEKQQKLGKLALMRAEAVLLKLQAMGLKLDRKSTVVMGADRAHADLVDSSDQCPAQFLAIKQ